LKNKKKVRTGFQRMTICAIVSSLSTTPPKQVVVVNAWRNTNLIINFFNNKFSAQRSKKSRDLKKNSIRNSAKIA